MAQSVSDRRKLDEAQALFDEVDMLRLESRERESVRAMLMLLGEMRFRTLPCAKLRRSRRLSTRSSFWATRCKPMSSGTGGSARASTGFAPGDADGPQAPPPNGLLLADGQ